jgi:hypothetical protein
MSEFASLEIEDIVRQKLPPESAHKLDSIENEVNSTLAHEKGEIEASKTGSNALSIWGLDSNAKVMSIDALVLHKALLDELTHRVVYAEQVLSIRTGASTSRPALNAE